MSPGHREGDVRAARLSPDRKVAQVREHSQARITRWRRQLQDKIRTERRARKLKIKAIREAQIEGLSDKGAEFIARFEGVRLVAYLDPVGIPTIGAGHTKDVHLGMSISMKEALRLLQEDARIAYGAVKEGAKIPLDQEQTDACISLAFNIGNAGFLGSTVLRRINDRASLAAIREGFLMWVKAGNQTLFGLVARRQAEARLFNTGHYS